MQYWKVSLYCADKYYGDVNIKRGIYQGDSLSPLLFVLALMPLSGVLSNTNKGFQLCFGKKWTEAEPLVIS